MGGAEDENARAGRPRRLDSGRRVRRPVLCGRNHQDDTYERGPETIRVARPVARWRGPGVVWPWSRRAGRITLVLINSGSAGRGAEAFRPFAPQSPTPTPVHPVPEGVRARPPNRAVPTSQRRSPPVADLRRIPLQGARSPHIQERARRAFYKWRRQPDAGAPPLRAYAVPSGQTRLRSLEA